MEAYFDQVDLAGLTAKMVLSFDLPQDDLKDMYQRGLRISALGSGSHKVTLHPDDRERVRRAPISSITYLPRTHLDEALIVKRFGEPAQRILEPENNVVHFLYPRLGLDVAVSETEKEVLQYLPPEMFPRLMTPLLEQSETLR